MAYGDAPLYGRRDLEKWPLTSGPEFAGKSIKIVREWGNFFPSYSSRGTIVNGSKRVDRFRRGSIMERDFDIQTGSIAIGDPTMGLVTFNLRLPVGRYRCDPGTLRRPTEKDAQTVTLDGPYLFVVDAALAEKFLKWYHRTLSECGFVIPKLAMRLGEAAKFLGAEVGFYWEETLSGRAQEGTYAVDTRSIVNCG